MRPNFLIIGAPKAATTWLADCLREHPDVFIPPQKELRYFCGANLDKGVDWYERQFREARSEAAIGEASPSYLGRAEAPERIRDMLPDARLILSLRHPVEQAYSFYWHLMSRGVLPRGLEFARFFAEQRPRASHYGQHVARYLEFFRPEQMLILVYERDILAEPLDGLRKCQRFLDIDASHTPAALAQRRNPARNVSALHGPLVAVRRGLALLPQGLRQRVKHWGKAAVARLPVRQAYVPLSRELRGRLLHEHCLGDLAQLQRLAGVDLTAWTER